MTDYFYSDLSPTYVNDVLSGYDREYDIDAVKNSLLNLFLINLGEVPGKPKQGTPLRIEVFDIYSDFTEQYLETSIKNVAERYEPRVNIEKLTVSLEKDFNRIIVILDFTINFNNRIVGDTLYIPFAHNSKSYIGNRDLKRIQK